MQRFRQWRVWFALAGMLLVALFVFPIEDRPSFGGAIVLLLVVFAFPIALRRWPAADDFVRRRARRITIGGIVFAVIGSTGFFALSVSLHGLTPATSDTLTTAASISLVAGFVIAAIPSLVRRARESEAETQSAGKLPAAPARFDPANEIIFAFQSLRTGSAVFLRIMGPWLVTLIGVFSSLSLFVNAIGHDRDQALALLLVFALALIVAIYVVPATIAVAWFRWIVEGRRPSGLFVWPGRAAFAVAWRLWLFLSIVGKLEDLVDHRLTSAVAGVAGKNLALAVGVALPLLALWLVSSMAVRLPAIAIGDRQFTQSAAMIHGRRMWPGLPLALIGSIAPFILAAWAIDAVWNTVAPSNTPTLSGSKLQLSMLVLIAIDLPFVFGGIASGATVLASAYLRAKRLQSEIQSDPTLA